MKLCTDCKHCHGKTELAKCVAPDNFLPSGLKPNNRYAAVNRIYDGCGPDGKWWEPKPQRSCAPLFVWLVVGMMAGAGVVQLLLGLR